MRTLNSIKHCNFEYQTLKYIKRLVFMIERLLKLPFEGEKSFFLFGPRGTGKTTWVRKHASNPLYIDLLESRLYRQFLADPQAIENLVPPDFSGWVIIDEVQKIPALLNEIHRLIERKRLKFILTGSSARSLRRKGVNLLAGRALTYSLHPLTAYELDNNFRLEHVIKYGSIAAILNERDPEKYLEAYTNTYLREEVLQEGLTRNISDFSRFLETASFSQGSQINLSSIAREASIHQKVVTSYFNILEDLLLSFRLYPFTKRAKRRLVVHPKFYFFDVGIYQSLRPKGPLDSPEEVGGIALESLFLQNLIAINDYLQFKFQLYFWRTSNGLEVDFILYGERGLYAIEIKHARTVDSKDFRGLMAFKNDYPMATIYLIYCGDRKKYHNDVQVIPYVEALLTLPELIGK